MNTVKQFLSRYNISSHSMASGWVFVCGLYAISPEFRLYIIQVYNSTPHSIHQFVGCVVIPALIYWRAQKKAQ